MLLNGFYTEGGGARSIMSPASTARKVAGGYILNGKKVFATLVPAVDYFGISISLADYTGPDSGGCVFLLPRDTPGLEVEETWDAMGMRATGSHTITMQDVFASPEQRIGEEGRLFEEFSQVAHWYCLSFSACYLGIGQTMYNHVLDYARTRKVQKTGQRVGDLAWNRFAIGEMYNRLEACRTLLYTTAREISEQRPYAERQIPTVEMLRTYMAENMLEVGNLATRIAGGLGYLKGSPVERAFRRPALRPAAYPETRRGAGTAGRNGTGVLGRFSSWNAEKFSEVVPLQFDAPIGCLIELFCAAGKEFSASSFESDIHNLFAHILDRLRCWNVILIPRNDDG